LTVESFLPVLVGLALGSFLNVVITRLPQGEAVWASRSRGPHCRRPLSWYNNIPLFSFLWMRGTLTKEIPLRKSRETTGKGLSLN
jgi:prepilin signal peptidase PulO-like enzyme (type II secretory pathway)